MCSDDGTAELAELFSETPVEAPRLMCALALCNTQQAEALSDLLPLLDSAILLRTLVHMIQAWPQTVRGAVALYASVEFVRALFAFAR